MRQPSPARTRPQLTRRVPARLPVWMPNILSPEGNRNLYQPELLYAVRDKPLDNVNVGIGNREHRRQLHPFGVGPSAA